MSENDKDWWGRVSGQPIGEWFPVREAALILAVFAVVIFVGPLGQPKATQSEQAGFRGTGMATIRTEEKIAGALAQVDAYPPEDPPYAVEEGAALAKDVYENVQVLGHLTEDNFNRLMNSITAWVSPDQGCAYCHGEDGNFAHDDIYAKVVARRMIQMTQNINANWQTHVKGTGVNCYTCHRGQNVPSQIWFNEEPQPAGMMLGWRNNQNTPSDRLASTSLPSNVFETFLLDDQEIRVISPDSRTDATGQDIKATEWTFGLMVHMSTSLGVNCAYCHNTRSMNVWEQGPPQRVGAWYGIRMVRELNNEYLAPLQPVYPAHRLGPTGDAPKANCSTCHQGVYKPLNGKPMLENWPELAAPAPQQSASLN